MKLIKCINCKSTENLNFVKTFVASTIIGEEVKDWKKYGWESKWEPIAEWTRLELQKMVNNDIENNIHAGEEYYCNDCLKNLKWSVVND